MKCIAKDCERNAAYKAAQLCQKHYFRMWRNGSLEKLPTSRNPRVITPNGYVRVYDPAHDLADKGGYVFEHRHVAWGELDGVCGSCRICGKPESWATCHVDHKDDDRQNNAASNLRVLCRGCNVSRGMTPESQALRTGVALVEFDGRRLTAHEWSRDPKVKVCGPTILRRKRAGMSDRDALFAPKVTHNGNRKP